MSREPVPHAPERRARSVVAALPWAAMAVGVCFSLFLLTRTRPGVFFSGDGGVKFLLVDQLASGKHSMDLDLPAPPWVRELWADGQYPIEEPFTYEIGGRRYAGFPVLFPVLSAPVYAALGFRGLFVLPTLALWAAWAVFVLVLRRAAGGRPAAAAAVAALVCSPLSLYGAMFWEHTLGVALAVAGFALLLSGGAARASRAALAGALVGASCWFRSELLCLAAILVGAASSPWLGVRMARRWVVAGVAAALAPLAASNAALYGTVVGVHGLQVTRALSLADRAASWWYTFWHHGVLLVDHAPAVVLVLAGGAALALRRRSLDPAARLLLAAGAAFVVLVPAILPPGQIPGSYGGKQWGPRYLLVVLPLVLAAAPAVLEALWASASRIGRAALVLAAALAIAQGLRRNLVDGTAELSRDYAFRVLPALHVVMRSDAVAVVVAHTFIAQELAAVARAKPFVLAKDTPALQKAARAAFGAGAQRLLILADPMFAAAGDLPAWPGTPTVYMRFSRLGTYGAYSVHRIDLWTPQR